MAYFEQSDLEKWSRGEWVNTHSVPAIRGFSIDSRNVDSNEMFIALRSEKRDGHAFVGDAARRGASAALTEQFIPDAGIPQLKVKQGSRALQDIALNHRRRFKGSVVGVTGSCGKTSTKDLISLLLGEKRVLKTAGNFNNTLGVPLTLLRLDSEQHDFGVVEAGINTRDEMNDLAGMIDPEIGVVTMIGRAHLEGLGSLEHVAKEKATLLAGGRPMHAVIYPLACHGYAAFKNLDHTMNRVLCPLGEWIPSDPWIRPVLYWSVSESRGRWSLFLQESGKPRRKFVVGNLSAGMRQNAALAILTASELGVSDADIQWRLMLWHPSANRGEVLQTANGWVYSDCYNANPDSMIDSLRAFEATFEPAYSRLYVLGSMHELGENSAIYHEEVGSKLKLRSCDRAICVGRDAQAFYNGLVAAGNTPDQVALAATADEISLLVSAFEGVVFLKGSRSNRLERLIPENSTSIPTYP